MRAVIGPNRRRAVAALLTLLVFACAAWLSVRSPAGARPAGIPLLRIDTHHPEVSFSAGALGLSTETAELANGNLRDRPSLTGLMRLLGPAVLRVGGNSVDTSWWTSNREPPPSWAGKVVTPTDLSALERLLRATGWRVLLGVNLGHFEPARAADEAQVAQRILGPRLLGLELGNEPDDFAHREFDLRPRRYGLSEYLSEALTYVQAIDAAAPGLAVYGPALTQNAAWLSQIGSSAQLFSGLTQHFYGTSTCPGGRPAVAPTIEGLLSPAEHQLEQKTLEAIGRLAATAHRPALIGETNNTACLASPAVSPTFASALWALDWALRASHGGMQGINFHGNIGGVCGAAPETPICAPSAAAAGRGRLLAQPEYYGLLAARRMQGGRFVPTTLTGSAATPELQSWATLSTHGTLKIAIENFATAGATQRLAIAAAGYKGVVEQLSAPAVSAVGGVLLGRARVSGAGRWRPRPKRLRLARVSVPPASAVILTLRPSRSRG